MRTISRPLVLLLATAAAALGVGPAWAADPDSDQGLISIRLLDTATSADPRARRYLVDHLKPGTTIRRNLQLTSTAPHPRGLRLYAGAAEIRDQRFVFAPGHARNELTGWIRFDRTAVQLPPQGSTVVRATIHVPRKAWRGERYGVLWAEPTDRTARTGIRIYLSIGAGNEPPTDFQIDRLIALRRPDGRPELQAAVHNNGQRAVDMRGTLRLTEGPGGQSAGPFRVDPGTSLPPGGDGNIVVLLDEHLPNGPWQATLALASGRIRRNTNASITFPRPGAPPEVRSTGFFGTPIPHRNGALVICGAIAVLLSALALFRRLRTRK